MPESSIINRCKQMNGMVKLGSGGTDVFCKTMETPLEDCALEVKKFYKDTYDNALEMCQKELGKSARFGDKLAEIAHTAIEAARDEDGSGLAKWAVATIISVSAVAVAAAAAVAAVIICKKKKSKESKKTNEKNMSMNTIGVANQGMQNSAERQAIGITYTALNKEVKGGKPKKALHKTDVNSSSRNKIITLI